MNTSIVTRKMDLTDAMRDYINSAFTQFEKYELDIIAVKAIISETRKDRKPQLEIEFTIQLAKHDTIVIRHSDKDLYTAIDIATERAKKVLRRYHDRISNNIHIRDKATEVPLFMQEADNEPEANDTDEIVPSHSIFDKPIEVEEAVAFLKDTNAMFVVFEDLDGKQRILYRRKDGRFGLY